MKSVRRRGAAGRRERLTYPLRPLCVLRRLCDELTLLSRKLNGSDKQAESFLLRAKSMLEKASPELALSMVGNLYHLGGLYKARDDFEKAQEFQSRALEKLDQLAAGRTYQGLDAYMAINILVELGEIYHLQGARDKSEPFYRRALDMAEKLYGRGDAKT